LFHVSSQLINFSTFQPYILIHSIYLLTPYALTPYQPINFSTLSTYQPYILIYPIYAYLLHILLPPFSTYQPMNSIYFLTPSTLQTIHVTVSNLIFPSTYKLKRFGTAFSLSTSQPINSIYLFTYIPINSIHYLPYTLLPPLSTYQLINLSTLFPIPNTQLPTNHSPPNAPSPDPPIHIRYKLPEVHTHHFLILSPVRY
jgi:hypothetical protein